MVPCVNVVCLSCVCKMTCSLCYYRWLFRRTVHEESTSDVLDLVREYDAFDIHLYLFVSSTLYI